MRLKITSVSFSQDPRFFVCYTGVNVWFFAPFQRRWQDCRDMNAGVHITCLYLHDYDIWVPALIYGIWLVTVWFNTVQSISIVLITPSVLSAVKLLSPHGYCPLCLSSRVRQLMLCFWSKYNTGMMWKDISWEALKASF